MIIEKDEWFKERSGLWARICGFVFLFWFLIRHKQVLLVGIESIEKDGDKIHFSLKMRYKRMDPEFIDLLLKEIVNENDKEADVLRQAKDILKR